MTGGSVLLVSLVSDGKFPYVESTFAGLRANEPDSTAFVWTFIICAALRCTGLFATMDPAVGENGGAIDGYGPPITRKAPTSIWVGGAAAHAGFAQLSLLQPP